MIGFGELRRLSVLWGVDIAAVERAYCIDWVVKGIFDHAVFSTRLVLRGGSALRYAHCADYPIADDPEFLVTQPLGQAAARDALEGALRAATAAASGLRFSLIDFTRGSAKVEYTGPLGRRSAAQPRIVLSFVPGQTRQEPVRVPLIHLLRDHCTATVSAVALDEFAAERIVMLAQTLRARDVFDLWFVLTRARERIDPARMRTLAEEIAQAKNVALPRPDAVFDPTRRGGLERAWANALRRVPGHPPFAQVERELTDALGNLL